MRRLILFMMVPVLTSVACDSARSGLPNCPGPYKAETWTNCFGETTRPSGKFVGEFKDGKPNGQGTWSSPSGDKYVGAFKDGSPSGQGTMTWANGHKYVGEWRDSEMHGKGTRTWPNGEYVGEYRDGKMDGQGIEYSADGSVLRSGIWRNDDFVKSQ